MAIDMNQGPDMNNVDAAPAAYVAPAPDSATPATAQASDKPPVVYAQAPATDPMATPLSVFGGQAAIDASPAFQQHLQNQQQGKEVPVILGQRREGTDDHVYRSFSPLNAWGYALYLSEDGTGPLISSKVNDKTFYQYLVDKWGADQARLMVYGQNGLIDTMRGMIADAETKGISDTDINTTVYDQLAELQKQPAVRIDPDATVAAAAPAQTAAVATAVIPDSQPVAAVATANDADATPAPGSVTPPVTTTEADTAKPADQADANATPTSDQLVAGDAAAQAPDAKAQADAPAQTAVNDGTKFINAAALPDQDAITAALATAAASTTVDTATPPVTTLAQTAAPSDTDANTALKALGIAATDTTTAAATATPAHAKSFGAPGYTVKRVHVKSHGVTYADAGSNKPAAAPKPKPQSHQQLQINVNDGDASSGAAASSVTAPAPASAAATSSSATGVVPHKDRPDQTLAAKQNAAANKQEFPWAPVVIGIAVLGAGTIAGSAYAMRRGKNQKKNNQFKQNATVVKFPPKSKKPQPVPNSGRPTRIPQAA